MNSLEERLKARREHFEDLCKSERKIDPIIQRLSELYPEDDLSGSIYCNYAYLYLTTKLGLEEAEESIINTLSEELQLNWERSVQKNAVKFAANIEIEEGYTVYLEVLPAIEGTCKIVAKPTGRTRQESKLVYVDVPEFEYLVDCGEEEKEEERKEEPEENDN